MSEQQIDPEVQQLINETLYANNSESMYSTFEQRIEAGKHADDLARSISARLAARPDDAGRVLPPDARERIAKWEASMDEVYWGSWENIPDDERVKFLNLADDLLAALEAER